MQPTNVSITIYNMGQPHDTLGKLIRHDASKPHPNPLIQNVYAQFKPLHDAAMEKHAERLSKMTEEEKRKLQWWDTPVIKPGPEVSAVVNPFRDRKSVV